MFKAFVGAVVLAVSAGSCFACELPGYPEQYVNIYDARSLELVEQYAMNPVEVTKNGVKYVSAMTFDGNLLDYVKADVFVEKVKAPNFLHRDKDGLL